MKAAPGRSQRRDAKRAYHHGDLRDALVTAGALLIEQGGADSLTLRAVAEATGVSRQAPYHHFGDKDGLLAAIATAAFERLGQTMRAEARKHASAEDRLVALGAAYVKAAREAPRLFALCSATFVGEVGRNPDLERARDAALGELRAAVEAHIGPKRSAREKAAAVAAAWALAHGLAHLVVEHAELGVDKAARGRSAFIDEAFRTLVRGMTRG